MLLFGYLIKSYKKVKKSKIFSVLLVATFLFCFSPAKMLSAQENNGMQELYLLDKSDFNPYVEFKSEDIKDFFNPEESSQYPSVNLFSLYIIKKYPDFQGIDEVYFFMASNLMEVGQPLKSIRYYKLVVEKFAASKYAPDALFEMGEYFFNSNNVFKALPNYKMILDKHKNNKFYDFALYKYAWCMYNVGEYAKSVKLFQKVVERAAKDGKKVDLKEDALKDMVAPYAESGTVDDAERYFKNIVKNKKYYIMVLRKLAQIYFEQDRSKDAIVIYRKLMIEAPLSTSAPGWQKQVVEASKKMNNKAEYWENIKL
jgi:tetratricopeptide (TPR) repeat protein